MSILTKSEKLFEAYCNKQKVCCHRLPENDNRAADYEIVIGSINIIVEIKQLDKNKSDKNKHLIMGQGEIAIGMSPSKRVQRHISKAYQQIKNSCDNKHPGIVVLYNNAGILNHIDAFTISKAMYGEFSVSLNLDHDRNITVGDHRFRGKRKVTKDTLRALSAVAVLDDQILSAPKLVIYHNPYSEHPIKANTLTNFASEQYIHQEPHEISRCSCEPEIILT